MAGLTWVVLLGIGAGLAWVLGLKEQLDSFKALQNAADADGDGKVSLEEMLG